MEQFFRFHYSTQKSELNEWVYQVKLGSSRVESVCLLFHMIGATSIHTVKKVQAPFSVCLSSYRTSYIGLHYVLLTVNTNCQPFIHYSDPGAGPAHVNCPSAENQANNRLFSFL